jgi:hypothetical protein
VDASQFAVGATLEQGIDKSRKPTIEDVRSKKTVPVAFMSRKLTPGQTKWVAREQETYAIILALLKWESWIGLQPVTVLTDHKALQEWLHEALGVPSGPLGRRLRWHLEFSKFDLEVGYIPGKENMICDILSRWAYPASKAFRDLSKHGSEQDVEDVRKILAEEARDIAEQEKFKASQKEQHPPVAVSPGDDLHVARGGADSESSTSAPMRFTFRDPRRGGTGRGRGSSIGQQLRPGMGVSRKSPPPREVGSGTTPPDGDDDEPELDDGSSDDEDEPYPQHAPPPGGVSGRGARRRD